MSLFRELKRRNVIRVAVAYAVTAWLLVQVVDLVLDNIGAPDWVMQTLLLILAVGFPIAIVFAWAFEITPEGVKRESEVQRSESITRITGRRLDYITFGLLALTAVYFFWESRFHNPQPVTEQTPVATSAAAPAQAPARTDNAPPSIAVLPFINLSSDPEQEYFSDGISEELLNVLAQIPDLRVAARTSSFQFKGDNRNISEIAQLLKVNHVLEGSVRKAGKRLRITAQLIDASNGYHLWSETYDRELQDVFAIQDEISAAIGEALKKTLSVGEATAASAAPRVAETANTAAYEAYLQGRYLINQRGNRALTQAVQELEKAVRLDPRYAPAHAQLAIAYTLLSYDNYGDLQRDEVVARAQPHIDRAFELTAVSAEAWGARCLLASTVNESRAAIEYGERALQLNPAYIDVMNWVMNTATAIGDYPTSYALLRRMQEVDPLSFIGRANFVTMELAFTDPQEAHRVADQLVPVNPAQGYLTHASTSFIEGEFAASLRWSLLAYRANPLDDSRNLSLVFHLVTLGLPEEAGRLFPEAHLYTATNPAEFKGKLADISRAAAGSPGNLFFNVILARAYFFTGQYTAALETYAGVKADFPDTEAVVPGIPVTSLEYAWLLRHAGDEVGAEAMLAYVETDIENRRDTPMTLWPQYLEDRVVVASLRGNVDEALELLQSMSPPLSWVGYELEGPLFDPLRQEPGFSAFLERHRAWIAKSRQEVIAMMCQDNPIPDAWQPLPETCEPVTLAAGN
ncbi:hypothetical protein [Haliea sp. E17]|uniref:hypothetical protein n=1 Tax=Haliea sp. E17 TaxID=3401576 RepID=UPI003AAA3EBC